MMISILISVYNYDCSALVSALHAQGEALTEHTGERFEILVGDDGSRDEATLTANRGIGALPHCRLIECAENRGRSKIRNFLAAQAAGNWLLFLDCDAEVRNGDFLKRYAAAAEGSDVVCGGIDAPDSLPSPHVTLRYKYERRAREVRTPAYRRANPYLHFSTFSFLVKREVFESIRFDENCREYGYEDTLFGLRLKQLGFTVTHIDNPLIHTGMDTNAAFVDKSEQAMRTLRSLGGDIKRHSHVGSTALRLKRLHLLRAVTAWHAMFAPLERANLLSRHPSLLVLKLYKLGYFCSIGGVDA